MNLPNALTMLRILAVPVVVVALVGETPNGDALAAGVFALAALTDGLDGYIARSRGSITPVNTPSVNGSTVSPSVRAWVRYDTTGRAPSASVPRPSDTSHMRTSASAWRTASDVPSFAAAVNRDEVQRGIEELGVDQDEHIALIIEALAERSDELGL